MQKVLSSINTEEKDSKPQDKKTSGGFTLGNIAEHCSTSISDLIAETYPEFEEAEKSVFVLSKAERETDHGDYGSPEVEKFTVHPYVLNDIAEANADIMSAIEAKAVNEAGFGYTLDPIIPVYKTDEEDDNKDPIWRRKDTGEIIPFELVNQIHKEKEIIESFINNLCPQESYTRINTNRVRWINKIKFCYWEVIRGINGDMLGVQPIKDQLSIRHCKEDSSPVKDYPYKVRVGSEWVVHKMDWYFKRYVQIGKMGKKTYFKSFGDERFLDKRTGKYYQSKAEAPTDAVEASELIVHELSGSNVRWFPAFAHAQIAKGIALTNRDTMNNNGVPRLFVVLIGSDDENVEKIVKNQFKRIKKEGSREMIAFVRVKPSIIGAGPDESAVPVEMRFEPLSKLQEKEGMFLELDENCSGKIKKCFRLSDLFMGKADSSLNRATAYVMRKLAENQVFSPERLDFDEWVNKFLFADKGYKYWKYRSNSAELEDTETFLKLIELYLNNGMVPNEFRSLAPELIGTELETIPEDWANLPKYLSIVQSRMNSIERNQKSATSLEVQKSDPFYRMMEQIIKTVFGGSDGDVNSIKIYKPKQCK